MAANGSELFLDRNTRLRKIQQIAGFLAQIEGKDPHVRASGKERGIRARGGGGGDVGGGAD